MGSALADQASGGPQGKSTGPESINGTAAQGALGVGVRNATANHIGAKGGVPPSGVPIAMQIAQSWSVCLTGSRCGDAGWSSLW